MPEKEKKNKKKIRIISEKVAQPFKEIKKEQEEKEETLEEEVEPEEQEEFTEFVSGERTTIVLQPSTTSAERVEERIENAPSAAPATTTIGEYEPSVYNMPEYTYEKEAFPERREMEERRIMIRPEDIRHERPRAELEEWHELRQETGARTTRDKVIEPEMLDRETRQPWETRTEIRKYRRRQ